jgi:sn-glycerol 3-phosphate transport system permease protein
MISFQVFKNYTGFAKSAIFLKVMGNTLYFSLLTVIPSMVIGLGLALIVNVKMKGVGFFRTAWFYPVVMPMIAIASIWMFIYMARTGMLDQFLFRIGLKPLDVLSNKGTVLPAMSVMYVWKEAGYLMIFFLSGLQNISLDLYEAAAIDGARPFTVFRRITLVPFFKRIEYRRCRTTAWFSVFLKQSLRSIRHRLS